MKVSLQSQVRFHKFAIKTNLRQLDGRPVDKTSWPVNFPPSTVNAFYMYSRNQVRMENSDGAMPSETCKCLALTKFT